jgi:hypothetical protein
MDFFRSLGGMFASSIMRLLVVAGTLAISYFLIVKPILNTTNDAIDKATRNIPTLNTKQIERRMSREARNSGRQTRRRINKALNGAGLRNQRKLLHCIQRAAGDVNRMQACSRRFS